MEFNFARNSYSGMPYFPIPLGKSLEGGSTMDGEDYRSNYIGDSLNLRRYMIQREIEKEIIREEIMAEMARKQALKDEVKREILMEKEFQVPVMHNPYNRGFSDYGVVSRMSSEPQTRAMMPEVESVPQAIKGKLLILPKPKETNLVRGKMIAETPPTKSSTGLPPTGVKSKSENFSCALCQVCATSEQALYDHIRGKKHKAKASKLKAKKPGTITKWGKNMQKKKNF